MDKTGSLREASQLPFREAQQEFLLGMKQSLLEHHLEVEPVASLVFQYAGFFTQKKTVPNENHLLDKLNTEEERLGLG